jgi:hypothetical protein
MTCAWSDAPAGGDNGSDAAAGSVAAGGSVAGGSDAGGSVVADTPPANPTSTAAAAAKPTLVVRANVFISSPVLAPPVTARPADHTRTAGRSAEYRTRRRLLEASWADDGVYTDPESTIRGRDELVDAIAAFHVERPGVRIEVRSRIDAFDRQFRFVWATVDGSGRMLSDGLDVGELDKTGRIVALTGFYGVVP